MILSRILLIPMIFLFALSCGNERSGSKKHFKLNILDASKGIQVSQPLRFEIKSKSKPIDSVKYYLGSSAVNPEGSGNIRELDISYEKLGKRDLKAEVFSGGEMEEITHEVILLSANKPILYTYEILETFPHDIKAYTQGLEFENDTLYESTGRTKQSSLRKVDYTTGEVIRKVPLGDQYFGEGITIINDKIYQLTWQNKTGFIYQLKSMEKSGTFVYGNSKEGWGLCNDNNVIYKSDGTERIWTLNPETLAEEDYIQLYTNTSKIPRVNELEWVDDKIYANIWQRDAIAIVNPETGAVEGVIDLSSLKENVTKHDELDVLNGIAYKGEPGIIYVTGKNWDKLFKIRIIEK